MTREAAPADERSRSLDDLVADYLESVEAGRPLDRTELLRLHPEWSADLRAFFTAHDRFDGLLAPLRTPGTLPSVSNTPAEGSCRPEPRAGDRIGNHELLEELGRGGMGVVWKARDLRLGRDVALKMLLTDSDEAGRRRFRLEAEAVAGLDHPNVVPIYEVGEQDGRPFFSMKLIEGGNLARQIAHRAQPPRDAARLLAVVARAVDYAHQRGILHRDLKPANILLQIADFRLQIENQLPGAQERDAGKPICNLQSAICNLQSLCF